MSLPQRAALLALLGGNSAPALSQCERDPGSAEAIMLRAELSRALPSVEPPTIAELDERLSAPASDRAPLVRAAYALGLSAMARLDGPWVRAWSARATRLAEGADEVAHLEAEALALWAAFTEGFPGKEGVAEGDGAAVRALEVRAGRLGLADVVIELASLSALASLAAGDLEAARLTARRASRMARTEALPQAEYLAHLVLARVRRFEGRPHMAMRIAASLARVAPPAFLGWLALELSLSGALEEAERAALAGNGPALEAAQAVLSAVRACGEGSRAGFTRGLERARIALTGVSGFDAELSPLGIGLDPERAVPEGGPLADFLRGRTDTPPGSLAGPLSFARPGESLGAARVIAGPGRAPRRVLGLGLGLTPAPLVELGRESGARQHRRESMLAVLALAGPRGLSREELFRAVWGFQFAAHLHQGVLDVALHRMRGGLEGAAELVRTEDDRLVLSPLALFSVTDPRVERALDDRVLALVASGTGMKARELAGDLDVPLRTVQAALGRLEEAGACVRDGEGARVSYRVEDTTFREPTRPR